MAGAFAAPASAKTLIAGRRVLLVDDDMRNIFALTSVLEQRGLTVEPARNGVEALEKLDALPEVLNDLARAYAAR